MPITWSKVSFSVEECEWLEFSKLHISHFRSVGIKYYEPFPQLNSDYRTRLERTIIAKYPSAYQVLSPIILIARFIFRNFFVMTVYGDAFAVKAWSLAGRVAYQAGGKVLDLLDRIMGREPISDIDSL